MSSRNSARLRRGRRCCSTKRVCVALHDDESAENARYSPGTSCRAGSPLVTAERESCGPRPWARAEAPAIELHLHIAETRPAGGIDADGCAQVDLRLLVADRTHAAPPIEIFRPPALECALKLLVEPSALLGMTSSIDLDEAVGGDGAAASLTMSSALMGFSRSVGFQVQASVPFQARWPDCFPIEPGIDRDVAQRQHHAFFHGLEAANVIDKSVDRR